MGEQSYADSVISFELIGLLPVGWSSSRRLLAAQAALAALDQLHSFWPFIACNSLSHMSRVEKYRGKYLEIVSTARTGGRATWLSCVLMV